MSEDEKLLMQTLIYQNKTLIEQIEYLKKELKELMFTQKPSYTTEDMLKIFGITRPTLQKWRNKGYIGYTQIGSTFCYSPDDIKNFLNYKHCDAYAQT